MMLTQNRKAFTMLEIVFVIVVIGILSAVAIPKFAVNRDDAVVSRAKTTVASIRSAVATERQKRILRGEFDPITRLGLAVSTGYDTSIFDDINEGTDNSPAIPVFAYSLKSCKNNNARECWYTADNITYTFKMPVTGNVDFNLTSSRFNCKLPDSDNCKELTR